jgi:transcriptional regulator with XRE-family HTH domain
MTGQGGFVDKILERLESEFNSEEARYAYADSVANAFLTSQIKKMQEENGFTQEELAIRIGTKQSGISRWLSSGFATCKVETLRKFAQAYGVRLWVCFKDFGTLPTDIRGFTPELLAPHRFEKDPAFRPIHTGDLDPVDYGTAYETSNGNNSVGVMWMPSPDARRKSAVSELSGRNNSNPSISSLPR